MSEAAMAAAAAVAIRQNLDWARQRSCGGTVRSPPGWGGNQVGAWNCSKPGAGAGVVGRNERSRPWGGLSEGMFRLFVLMVAGYACCGAAFGGRPNVVVVLVDDMGFSDLGCYGGEAPVSPNLDEIARRGVRFTQFYNTGRCWTTRASLMTGLYPHQARHAMPWGDQAPEAYQGTSVEVAAMLPEMLKPAGYRSYHVGKWHLDSNGKKFEATGPLARGFDRSYCFKRQDNHFNPTLVYDEWERIGRPAGESAEGDGKFYSTSAMTDRAVAYLQEHSKEHGAEPFFLYLAYTAPHFPLHALPQDIALFKGKYRQGWDAVRRARLARQRELGLLDCELPERDEASVAWDSLGDADKEMWDTRMAIHMAMMKRVDIGVGRLMVQLEGMGAAENTLLLFLSDNGASAEYIVRGDGNAPGVEPGSGPSYLCLEVGWSNASNTPFRQHKMWTHEGGTATPLIAYWPERMAKTLRAGLTDEVGHVIDVVPTVLEAAGLEVPDTLPGRSLAGLLERGELVGERVLFWEHTGNKALRVGDWKLVAEHGKPWELFDLERDRSEMSDLAGAEIGRVSRMAKRWQTLADGMGVVAWETLPQSKRKPTADYRKK